SWSVTTRERHAKNGHSSTVWCIRTATSPRCRSRSATTPGFDLDRPLPDIPESNASKSGRQRVIDRARRDNLTVRQLAQIAGSYGGLAMVGTPAMIADQMEEWLFSNACDGFNIMFPWVPGGL